MKQLFFLVFSLSLLSAEYVYSPSEPTGNEIIIPSPAKQDFQQKEIHNSGAISETVMSNDEETPLQKPSLSLNLKENNYEDENLKKENSIPLSVEEKIMTDDNIEEASEEEFGDKDFNKYPLSVKEQVMN